MVVPRKIRDKLDMLRELRTTSLEGGGASRVEAQHQKGKLTARERIALLLDGGTFEELDPFVRHRASDFGLADSRPPGDAVVTGYGRIDGRLAFVFAQDFTVMGGSLSEVVGQKICKVMDLAVSGGAPIVGLIDSGGARIQEGVDSLAGYAAIFQRNVRASGVVPQISAVLGPAAGGATYSPALTDFVFMVSGIGQMYITGPDVVKAVTGEDVSHEGLGGTAPHSAVSGVAHFVYPSEAQCMEEIRRLLGFLPQRSGQVTPRRVPMDDPERIDEDLNEIIPDNPGKPYNMLEVITRVVDEGEYMQVHESFARNVLVGFARVNGWPVGVVAQQPAHLAGVLDINASVKAARFVRFCDAFDIPLVTFVDVPGFLPGVAQEHGGIIRHGAKLIYAYAEATVPKVSVVTRKAYGGAYIVMSSKGLRGDVNYAWPTAEIAVMGAEASVNILHRKELRESGAPGELRASLIADYEERFMNPYTAAARGLIDDVIEPAQTRPKIARALAMLAGKREPAPPKKHGSIPL